MDPNDLKLAVSAEQGLCSVLGSLSWQAGDGIVMLTDEYEGAAGAVRACARRHGLRVHTIRVPLPTTGAKVGALVRDWAARLAPQHRYRLAVMPEVTYQSGVKLPCRKISGYLHKAKIAVFVDGTMAVGQRDLTITGKHCDWYAASLCHWMFCPQGVGFLVAHPLKQLCTNTLTVSYFDRGPADRAGFKTSFEKEFSYTGLQDFAPWCAAYHAIEFAKNVCGGFSEARAYTHDLARRVAQEVGRLWGTAPLQEDGDFGAMPVMPLPGGQGFDARAAATLTAHLSNGPSVVRVVSLHVGGAPTLCARWSCQVYNELAEYVDAATVLRSLQQNPGYGRIAPPEADVLAMVSTLA